VLQAKGSAVCKAITVAEISKRRVHGLHQVTEIGLTEWTDGGQQAPTICITLSAQPLDETLPGYQPPLSDDEFACACALEANLVTAVAGDDDDSIT